MEIDVKEKINEFEREHLVSDIILLGFDGAIRRITFECKDLVNDGE
jgi:hypothetical protein